jgi:flagella basal body P-ring formation protein FlgA
MRRSQAAALLLLCAAAQGAPVGLDLHPDVLVRGKAVRLGDVAAIGALPAEAGRLAGLQVGVAPMAGYTETFSRSALEAALRSQAVFSNITLEWHGAERVVVRRAGTIIDGTALADAARHMLQSTYGARYAQLELTPVGIAADVQVPDGVVAVRAREKSTVLRQRTTVWVDVLVDGAVVRSAAVPFQVRALNTVLVARRPLPADAALAPDDFRSERLDVLALATAPAPAPVSWNGLRLMAALAEGDVLPARSVVPAGAVRRGDRVRLVVDDAALRIETAAVAQEDGIAGARVRVMPVAGGEAVVARVMGQGVVAIGGI